MDLLLDPDTWDLDLSNGGTPVTVEGTEAISQHIRQRLQFFLAEWFADFRQGVPWFQQIFDRGFDAALTRSLLTRVIADTPGVGVVASLVFDVDTIRRRASMGWEAITTDGSRITESDFQPLITRQDGST